MGPLRCLAALTMFAAALSLAPPVWALREVPELRGRVTDTAGLLTPDAARRLEAQLAALERETTHQVAVLTVPGLAGEDIESFSLRVAETWALGHEGLDNGALIVVASEDRKARIEVGYGLEGVIPDAVAARILRERMIPRFRAGDLAGGIADGAEAVVAAARGELIPEARRPDRRVVVRGDPLGMVLFCALLGGLVGSVIGRQSRIPGALAGAALAAGGAWLLLSALGWATVAGVLGGLVGGGGPASLLSGGRQFPSGGGWPRSGGWGGGGRFGGGGGGFGGGGASGSW